MNTPILPAGHRLILMRHGEAEPYGAKEDSARTLTEKGRSRIVASVAGLMQRTQDVCPSFIACSPFVRTQQTATLLAQGFGADCPPIDAQEILRSGTGPSGYLELLPQLAAYPLGMVVGHMPDVSLALAALVEEGERRSFEPGGAACVFWAKGEVAAGFGTLEWFADPYALMD